ncbi:UNVERIFIED_CONTAM: hypothetical protein HDU68_010812 [Siphonaria sp. JEL0065]|nr:hypothetical protein HDU68_010812 [Siphonaria sp. JEL0065]
MASSSASATSKFPMPVGEKKVQDLTNTISRPIESIVKSGIFTEGGVSLIFKCRPAKHYGPYEFPGAPTHPHRGFETVSYIISGESIHHDSGGHTGTMKPGWVQWMTAGSGVLHSEGPTPESAKTGGIVEGYQIWVNLSKEKKMKTPKYQDYSPEKIPKLTVSYPGRGSAATAWVNVIAGEAHGVKSVITTESPIALIHYVLKPGAKVVWTIPSEHKESWNTGLYVSSGTGSFGDTVGDGPDSTATSQQGVAGDFIIFSSKSFGAASETQGIVFSNSDVATESLSVILMGGVPLNEPIARRGPFVMNTEEEIMQCFQDYSAGKFGKIKADLGAIALGSFGEWHRRVTIVIKKQGTVAAATTSPPASTLTPKVLRKVFNAALKQLETMAPWTPEGDQTLVGKAMGQKTCAFDANFDYDADNKAVYSETVLPRLTNVLNQNGVLTVMAYGQTGSGKTYTMSSIAEQLVNDLPLDDENTNDDNGIKAIITIVEIQGDNLRDLSTDFDGATHKKGAPIPTAKVLLDGNGLPVYMGVQEHVATTKQQVLDLFHHGFESRSTRSTLKNKESSRSHFVCTIKLVGGSTDVVLKLVDLAGSEAGSDKKEHDAETIKESIAINKSLMSLKDCIRKCSNANNESSDSTPTSTTTSTTHIPFRSSKLTMILKDALDPTTTRFTQTAIFALAAPTIADIPHTFNTYRYALALKSINNNNPSSTTDDSVLEHKSAAVAAEHTSGKQQKESTTPMAWSRLKLERWIELQFQNQVTLTHLLGPKGDPKEYGKWSGEFVLPPWKFLYSMKGEEWIENARLYGKYGDERVVESVREKYRKLFLKERVVVSDGVGGSVETSGKTVLMLAESVGNLAVSGSVGGSKTGASGSAGGAGGEKKLSRAEIAMAKAKAKGAALRAGAVAGDAKKGPSNSFRF